MCVLLFGGVWSPSCASFALRRVANDHRMDFPEETIQAVLKNFYADDCLKSVGTTEEAINIVHSLCKLLALVGFRLMLSMRRPTLEPSGAGRTKQNFCLLCKKKKKKKKKLSTSVVD